jgi:hypothetical protein
MMTWIMQFHANANFPWENGELIHRLRAMFVDIARTRNAAPASYSTVATVAKLGCNSFCQ